MGLSLLISELFLEGVGGSHAVSSQESWEILKWVLSHTIPFTICSKNKVGDNLVLSLFVRKLFSQDVFRGLQTLLAGSPELAHSLEGRVVTVAKPRVPRMISVHY